MVPDRSQKFKSSVLAKHQSKDVERSAGHGLKNTLLMRPAQIVEKADSAKLDGLRDRRLARLEIVSRLGAGGMGEVYRAHNSELPRGSFLIDLTPWTVCAAIRDTSPALGSSGSRGILLRLIVVRPPV